MNCTDIEKLILLQDSAEISRTQQQELITHLNSCTDCQQRQAELRLLRELLSATTQAHLGPTPKTLTTILNAAQRKQSPKPWIVQHLWPITLAAAAGITLCLTTLTFLSGPRAIAPGNTAQKTLAAEIIPLIAMISGTDPSQINTETDDTELTVLADEFLRLQDITLDGPAEINETTTLPEDYQPTTLLWNSSPGLLSERYG